MNKAPQLHSLALIAEEAIEQIQYGIHNARWLAALMGAISDTLGSDGPASLLLSMVHCAGSTSISNTEN